MIVFRPVPSIGMCSVPGSKAFPDALSHLAAQFQAAAERAAGGEPVCTPVAVE